MSPLPLVRTSMTIDHLHVHIKNHIFISIGTQLHKGYLITVETSESSLSIDTELVLGAWFTHSTLIYILQVKIDMYLNIT